MRSYLKLMRVHHYIKNALVFVALGCSGQLFVKEKLIHCLIGFISFCFASSAVYIWNDIKDCERDRLHPTKCNRPIASGKIPVKNACVLMVILFVIAIAANALVFSPMGIALIVAYIILNVAYSLGLKNVAIADVFILVSGFVIRVLYGAVITDIVVSDWLYLTVMSISFFFALGKRRNELKNISAGETRTVLKFYTKDFLDRMMYVCLGLANAFYALWAIEKGNIVENGGAYIWTVPLVILITMTYSMCIEGDSDGDPVEVLYHNKTLLVLCAIFGIAMVILLYA